MTLRNHLVETGVHLQFQRLQPQYDGHCRTEQNEGQAVVEDQPFEPVTRVFVEASDIANRRHLTQLFAIDSHKSTRLH
ncbi:hypothetical protein D3C84_847070 [compost metagenome]